MLRRVMHHLLKVPGKARRVSLHMNAVAQCQCHRQPGDRDPRRADRHEQRKGQRQVDNGDVSLMNRDARAIQEAELAGLTALLLLGWIGTLFRHNRLLLDGRFSGLRVHHSTGPRWMLWDLVWIG